MSKLIIKAEKLNYKIEDIKVSKDSGINKHDDLLPYSNYKFLGRIELEKKDTRTEHHSREGLKINIYSNGEITSRYGKWGQMPEDPKQQKEFMKKHSIDRLL